MALNLALAFRVYVERNPQHMLDYHHILACLYFGAVQQAWNLIDDRWCSLVRENV